MDNTYIPARLTTLPTVLNFSQESQVVLEVSAHQQQSLQIICSQEQLNACSLSLTLYEHAACTLTVAQQTMLPAQLTITVHLLGEYASLGVTARVVTTGIQQVNLHVQVMHAAPQTCSTFDLKGVAYGVSMFDFVGSVLLQASAHHAQATMHHKHLVVGGAARVTSQPTLEALHHTVTCGHGSAISYVDDEQLFYMTSRGLQSDKAQALLIDSFLS